MVSCMRPLSTVLTWSQKSARIFREVTVFCRQQRLNKAFRSSSFLPTTGNNGYRSRRYHLPLFEKPQRRDGSWGLQIRAQGQDVPILRNLLPRRPAFFVCVNKLSTDAARFLSPGTILLQQASFQFSSVVLGYPIRQTTVQQGTQSCFPRKPSCFFDKTVSEYHRRSHMLPRHNHVIQESYKHSWMSRGGRARQPSGERVHGIGRLQHLSINGEGLTQAAS
jgi:hypothetical protein